MRARSERSEATRERLLVMYSVGMLPLLCHFYVPSLPPHLNVLQMFRVYIRNVPAVGAEVVVLPDDGVEEGFKQTVALVVPRHAPHVPG